MADIGTDHGFLPLYLLESGISPKVIMTDISPYSLDKARKNFEKDDKGTVLPSSFSNIRQKMTGEPSPCHLAEFRVGDGLKVLEPAEVDAVVMAGIGGKLMIEILDEDISKSHSFGKFVLQPRRHPGELRHYLYSNGFMIEEEKLVREGKFLCEIMVVRSLGAEQDGAVSDFPPDSIEWEVPEYYAYREDDISREYIERKLNREKLILESKKESNDADRDGSVYNIEYLLNLLRRRT